MSTEIILDEDWFVCTNCRKPYMPVNKTDLIPDGMISDNYGMYICRDRITCQTKREIDRTRRFQP